MENVKRLFTLLTASALLFASAVYADPLEYHPLDGSGNGAITFNVNGGVPYTSFGDDYRVNSLSGRYSYVRPLNGTFVWPTAFNDTDYTESQGSYAPASYGFSLLYKLSIFGHPRVSPDTETAYPGITPGISGNYYDATCGNGGYDTLDEYLQENCSIKIYEPGTGYHTLFSGAQIDSSYFVQLLPSEDD
ncbi:MAG: hypothetical protein IJT95_06620 [Abditibacteriota bacterium]|nr:hypothetical protein [Abditibacteriota bacterium]